MIAPNSTQAMSDAGPVILVILAAFFVGIQSRSDFPSSSGTRAKFAAIRRASSRVSTPARRATSECSRK
jgi:hypothetical protein